MIGSGTLVNVAAIAGGSLVGLLVAGASRKNTRKR